MSDASQSDRLFPPHLLHARWRTYHAADYAHPVTGIVYRGDPRPTCGMPLGGLDTGCIDLEPNGMFGYSTIFNHLFEPRLAQPAHAEPGLRPTGARAAHRPTRRPRSSRICTRAIILTP